LSIPRVKELTTIKGLEDFILYFVDTEGNVISKKNNRPKILKPGNCRGYPFVILYDKHKNKKIFFNARLVAMAFIPCDDFSCDVTHKNGNIQDNRLENLEWVPRKERYKEDTGNNGFVLDEHITEKFKKVHIASIRKGVPVENDNAFLNTLLNKALDDHIRQFGLHKVMY